MSVSEKPSRSTPRLATRIERISPSPTMAVMAQATKLKQAGEDVVDFSAGQPDFNTPEAIKNAGIDAIESNFTRLLLTKRCALFARKTLLVLASR